MTRISNLGPSKVGFLHPTSQKKFHFKKAKKIFGVPVTPKRYRVQPGKQLDEREKTTALRLCVTVLTFHLTNCYVLPEKNDQRNSDDFAPRSPPVEPRILNASDKVRRFEIKQRANDEDISENRKLRRDSKQTVYLLNQVFEVIKKTIGKPEFRASKTMSFIDKVLDSLKDFVNGPEFRSSKVMRYLEKLIDIVKEAADGPEYRSGGKANMRTDLIHFKDGQPSLIFELRPNFFVEFMKKVLSSQLVERYMDDLAYGQRKPKRQLSRYP